MKHVETDHCLPRLGRWSQWYALGTLDTSYLLTGAIGFSMTLFQSLATAAGWDPVRGKGSSCLDADASGQCVLPWGGGTKSVSSIVLVATGVSFAVRFP